MAIGLGRLFGFTFPENFNLPYAAESVTAFWRRWHITLSTLVPRLRLHPARRRPVQPAEGAAQPADRVHAVRPMARAGVDVHCLGHVAWGIPDRGALWDFVSPRGGAKRSAALGSAARRNEMPERIFQHTWTLLAVLGGWVLFRCDTLAHASGYFAALAGLGRGVHARDLLSGDVILALLIGIPACLPVADWVRGWWANLQPSATLEWLAATAEVAACASLMIASAVNLIGGGYNPFLYFRF